MSKNKTGPDNSDITVFSDEIGDEQKKIDCKLFVP